MTLAVRLSDGQLPSDTSTAWLHASTASRSFWRDDSGGLFWTLITLAARDCVADAASCVRLLPALLSLKLSLKLSLELSPSPPLSLKAEPWLPTSLLRVGSQSCATVVGGRGAPVHTATQEAPARFVVEVLRSHAMAGEAVTCRFVTSLSTILLRASLEQPPRLVEPVPPREQQACDSREASTSRELVGRCFFTNRRASGSSPLVMPMIYLIIRPRRRR